MTDEFFVREAIARLGGTVNLITTDGAAGRHGMILSSVCTASDSPAMLLACVSRESAAKRLWQENGVLCVNVLAGYHRRLSQYFDDETDASSYGFADTSRWTQLATGAPILRDASVALDCRVAHVVESGAHSVFFCQIENAHIDSEGGAMVVFGGTHHSLADHEGLTL